jgi:hypothetical protein
MVRDLGGDLSKRKRRRLRAPRVSKSLGLLGVVPFLMAPLLAEAPRR